MTTRPLFSFFGYNTKAVAVALALLLVISGHHLTPVAAQPNAKPTGVLSTLKVGQTLIVKEVGDRYLLTIIEGQPGIQADIVLEVGQNYVVVEDLPKVHETRIPVTSIKAVVTVRIPSAK